MAHNVTLIPGDWIGPETCAVAQEVIAAAGVDVHWDEVAWSGTEPGEALLASCRTNGVVLKAKLDASRTAGSLPPTIQLRKALGMWATVRPVKALPRVDARIPDTDLFVIRETSEDIYSGLEHEVSAGVFEAVKVTTKAACERIAEFAFAYARRKQRRRLTIVHKANIMKMSDGLFLRTAQEVATRFPDIECDDVIVDALCMRLVRRPSDFDVLLTANLFGDIVSDLASGLAGGITAAASGSIGDGVTLFENPHGKSPGLTGTGRANPIPMIMTSLLMLRHLGEYDAAARIHWAVCAILEGGMRTVELGGDAGCAEVQRALIERL